MRNTATRLFIDGLLPLVHQARIPEAAALWRERQRGRQRCADEACAFGGMPGLERCTMCLEGRIRAMSLLAHTEPGEVCAYRHAANVVRTWLAAAPGGA